MAQRRMFSDKIVDTDAFLDMPISSQLLYFHLAMRADDDGFVANPKKIMRIISANDDDYKILCGKKFIIQFESGICVIKHWLIHNLIRYDRYVPTQYVKEKSMLIVDKETRKYSLDKGLSPDVIPNDNQMAPQYRLGKDRLGKDSNTGDKSQKEKFTQKGAEIIKAFEAVDPKNKTYYANKTQRAACDFLIKEYTLEKTLDLISHIPEINKQKLYIGQITTPHELKLNWVKLENAFYQSQNESLAKRPKVIY
jgi:hypothetical protein